MGYKGPAEGPAMDAFLQSSPAVAAKMGQFEKALSRGFNEGGTVPDYGFHTPNEAEPFKRVKDLRQLRKNPEDFIKSAQDKATLYQQRIKKQQDLVNKNPDNEKAKARLQHQQEQFNALQQNLSTARGMMAQSAAEQQREFSNKAMTDPTSLVESASVEKVSKAPGTTIKQSKGNLKGKDPTVSAAKVGKTARAGQPGDVKAETVKTQKTAKDVSKVDVDAAQGEVTGVIEAAEGESSIQNIEAAQGTAHLIDNPVQRDIEQGELITGSAVDMSRVEKMNEQLQAAEATPSKQATVQGQLESLMDDFEGGATPAWAAGAMRSASAEMARRGVGASSIAGQAIIQATMEAAVPIAAADAQTFAQFESQNLSNRQQTALFAAQQRAQFLGQEFDQKFQTRVLNAAKIADAANLNFSAEQQVQLENSRAVNTMNLNNLNNQQATVLAKASALANMDLANLNNVQQAAVQNAQNFLQMDLKNLDNEQQTELFKANANIQAILTDAAAENASRQFNASSENQTNRFMETLAAEVNQFNAAQTNAINMANTDAQNAARQFNATLKDSRDKFEAQNSLIIAQANTAWRQQIETTNTAMQNEANMQDAMTANGLTASALDQIWQRERDLMAFAFQASENKEDRELELLMADKSDEMVKWQADKENKAAMGYLATRFLLDWRGL